MFHFFGVKFAGDGVLCESGIVECELFWVEGVLEWEG